MKNIIVVSAHPDDEVLGAGGTLLRHVSNGDHVFWLIVTEMESSSKARVESREEEIRAVSGMLGVKKVFRLGYPTMSLSSSSLPSLVPEISQVFQETLPEIVYVVNRSDAHSDHRVVFDAVSACTKSFRYPFIKGVLMYECISETEFAPALPERAFLPNYFVDISEYMGRKLDIMKVYSSEIGQHPFPRSLENIKALALFRGAVAGTEYAEAFQLIKFIDK